ncbi:hypothetical protein AUJ78_01035 [Candidatus Peregrinibacteria bacterium CG1_02_41_10]|nr:MAG: hypothetical protein AUJ78_01035 [Candidatus Peregrinibacteria bacterium CG1_02_41_10]
MAQYKPGIIINPWAGKGNKNDKIIERIVKYARKEGIPIRIPKNLAELQGDLATLVLMMRVNLLLVWGGDGSLLEINKILIQWKKDRVIKDYPVILLLGGGSLKVVFKSLGFRFISPQRLLKLVNQKVKRGQDLPIYYRRPLKVKTDEGVNYGFVFMMGAVERVAFLFNNRSGEERTFWKGCGLFLKSCFAALFYPFGYRNEYSSLLKKFNTQIWLDGNLCFQAQHLVVSISRIRSLIPWLVKPYRGQTDGGDKSFFLGYDLSSLMIVLLLPLAIRGWMPKNHLRSINRPARHIKIGLQRPKEHYFMLDGERITTEGNDIEITNSDINLPFVHKFYSFWGRLLWWLKKIKY